jgi:hypothetical protein
MVNSVPREGLDPIELKCAQLLEAGREITIDSLGGLGKISQSASRLGASRLAPEILTALIAFGTQDPLSEPELLKDTFAKLVTDLTDEFALMGAIDALDAFRPLPGLCDEVFFASLIAKTTDSGLTGLARGIALEGSFRWAVGHRRWQFRLLDNLLGITSNDDKEFLRRSAKICGVAHSYWKEDGLLDRLAELAVVDCCIADASFELGLAALSKGLDAINRQDVITAFRQAEIWFEASIDGAEVNPEARLFCDCLKLLKAYDSGVDGEALSTLVSTVSRHAFELGAWSNAAELPPWLGLRRLQAIYWNQLALTLNNLALHLDEASWWEPSAVIEQYLLAVYTASRTLLRRTVNGGLEELIRPRISTTVSRQQGQAYALKSWVRRNLQHDWATEAKQLLSDVDRLVAESGATVNPTKAALAGTSLVALIDKSEFPDEIKQRLSSVVENAVGLHIENMTKAEAEIIANASELAEMYPDYRDNPHGRRLFDAILLWLIQFLYNRLEMTRADDPTVAYLFQRDDSTLPSEDLLQEDFFRWLFTNVAGSGLEATNVGSGRADILVRSSNERIVVEIKRELSDSSFESLAASYQAQTTDYQNVSVRLGFLFVLDLVSTNDQGTPHISSLVRAQSVQRVREDSSRLLVIVKVPGNRKRPSDLTKAAKGRPRKKSR